MADWSLRKNYGQTIEGKETLFEHQDGKCANPACSHVFVSLSDAQQDHNHDTDELRGLLCGRCNRALGLLDDALDRIKGLLTYRAGYV